MNTWVNGLIVWSLVRVLIGIAVLTPLVVFAFPAVVVVWATILAVLGLVAALGITFAVGMTVASFFGR